MKKSKRKKLSKKLRFSEAQIKYNYDGSVSCKYVCDVVIPSTHTVTNNIVTGIGKAKCNPSDTVDTRKGEMIADSRAKLDAYVKMCYKLADTYNVCSFKGLGIMANRMQEEAKRLADEAAFIQKMMYLAKAEKKHINWLIFHKD